MGETVETADITTPASPEFAPGPESSSAELKPEIRTEPKPEQLASWQPPEVSPHALSGYQSPEELRRERQQAIAQREQRWQYRQRALHRNHLWVALGSGALVMMLAGLFGLGDRLWWLAPTTTLSAWAVCHFRLNHLLAALVFLPACLMTFPMFWFGLQLLCLGMVIAITQELSRDQRRERDMMPGSHDASD